MLTTKNNCIIIAFGLLLIFIVSQVPLSDQPCASSIEGEHWEDFNYYEVSAAPKEWHEELGDTVKKTSTTGKGPLWARAASSITATRSVEGDPMAGLKLKL